MAQTGFTPLSLYYSATATNVPTSGNLVAGELAINTNDGKLFYKDSSGVVQTIASKATTAGTYSNITTNNLTIGTTGIGAGNASTLKNRIINGGMVIDQRNAGASVSVNGAVYTIDRWYGNSLGGTSRFSVQQNAGSVTPPIGFTNYVGLTSSSAYTPAATDYFQFSQNIEGFNIADLGWGTANAKTVTVSFWVYSSLTGQFGGAIRNAPNYTYTYPFSFTIASANTWQYITITIVGPNASQGVWNTNNTQGLNLVFDIGSGSNFLSTAGSWQSGVYSGVTGDTKLVGTNGATFYITGVQLEVGSSATGFEYRQYQQELALCQRYGIAINGTYAGYGNGTSAIDAAVQFPVTMRSSPTLLAGTVVMSAFGNVSGGVAVQSAVNSALPSGVTQNGCVLRFSNFTGLTTYAVYVLNSNAIGFATTYSSFLSAEL
jgi:hypothetical protein